MKSEVRWVEKECGMLEFLECYLIRLWIFRRFLKVPTILLDNRLLNRTLHFNRLAWLDGGVADGTYPMTTDLLRPLRGRIDSVRFSGGIAVAQPPANVCDPYRGRRNSCSAAAQ